MDFDITRSLRDAIGADGVRAGDGIEPKHFGDWAVTVPPESRPAVVVYPRSTEEVASVLRTCNEHRIPVVPQGGLTGLAGGAAPVPGCVALSLIRMRAVEEVDAAGTTMTVQAGVPLQVIQEAADAAGLLFPMDIGSRGSCQIGGNVSTNAGGVRVLRYGMTRDLVLGVEAVLADGTVLSSLNKMQKNNTGYDLKQLFIGSEGTLGVITRVVLKLFPKPVSVSTAFCALPDYDSVLEFLKRTRTGLGATLSVFEVMWPEFYALYCKNFERRPLPEGGSSINVLIEAMGSDHERDEAHFTATIEAAMEAGIITDAAIAQSGRQAAEIWELRDSVAEFSRTFGPHAGFDVSIPVARIGKFVRECGAVLERRQPGVRVLWFGHMADSNLHINIAIDQGGAPKQDIEAIVYGCVRDYGGSVSAEHGIGLLKRAYLGYSRTPAELAVMRRLKAALDPNGILNPTKIFAMDLRT
ncbi:MAG TPA: FAD-binding oxidoreductase [Acetobacteraceae bacterium]|jgi:FAD/FMN-containing dehydrogenase|nr:FAD-binding oxidoreductase [Acetobacteraceae bacterium]